MGNLLTRIGIDKNDSLNNSLIEYYRENDDALLKLMVALEFGVIVRKMNVRITLNAFAACANTGFL